jgi:predicted ATPase
MEKPAMLNKASIRNFKCLRDVQIELERFTVFVGPNGSGKSSILQALDVLCRSFQGQEGMIEGELGQALSRGSKESVELAAESGGKWYRYRGRSPTSSVDPHIADFAARGQAWSGQGHGVAADLKSADWKPWNPNLGVPSPLPLSTLLRLEASKLMSPNQVSLDPAAMYADGSGLHSALASMALNDPDSWQQLQADLRRIIPTIRRLRHTKPAMNQPAVLLFDTVGGDSVPANQVSEGTLLVLGLLAALPVAGRPSLVLLDDLDRGLHPRAQKDLISLLRASLETNPGLQLIATTHSPYMLDCMETKEVRMTYLRDDGATACEALTHHPKFAKWKDEMAPGEMWSLFGEKWLVEQGAAS